MWPMSIVFLRIILVTTCPNHFKILVNFLCSFSVLNKVQGTKHILVENQLLMDTYDIRVLLDITKQSGFT